VGGLPKPEVQHEVRYRGRIVARLDLAYPGPRLGVEYDGDQHRDRANFRNDLRRGNELQTCGWTVLRFVAADLHDREKVVATVRAALARGSPR
jgi:very-short-patch-repair endonuclease